MNSSVHIQMVCRKGGVGGVTSSVKNLLEQLQACGQKAEWPDRLKLWPRADIIHLHVSNPARVAQVAVLARLFGRRVVWTVHNNRLNAGGIPDHKRAVDRVDGIVFLNDEVCTRNTPHLKANVQWRLLTPIVQSKALERKALVSGKGAVKLLLYAYERTFEGGETYGVEWTLKNLDRMPDNWVFTIVDPKGQYAGHLPESARVTHIPHPVPSFPQTLKDHDVYLRPTTTDGQSVAVLESLSVGTPVVASDAVPRPPGVVLYKHQDENDFLRAIKIAVNGGEGSPVAQLSSAEDYVELYRACLKQI